MSAHLSSTTLALVKVERVGATLGAVVTGLRLAALEDREWLEVERAFLEHAVLIFPWTASACFVVVFWAVLRPTQA